MRTEKKYLDKNILVVSHIFVYGPAQALVEYLTTYRKTKKVLFIGHPLFFNLSPGNPSFSRLYLNNKKINEEVKKNKVFGFYFFHFVHFLLTIFWVVKSKTKFDLAVCYNNFNSLSVCLLKKLGIVKKVVYCTVDYTPRRYEGKLRNEIYHFMDRIAVYQSDDVWNLSSRMETARRKYRGIITPPGKQKVVPYGVWIDRIKQSPTPRINNFSFVFVGHLIEKQGLQDFIKAMPTLLKIFPKLKLSVIGTGPYKTNLQELVSLVGVEKQVNFLGYIEDHLTIEKLVSKSVCGLALYYKGDPERNFTYYSDPGKIKDYLSVGVPVLVTSVPHNAKEIEKNKCGVVTKTDVKSIRSAVSKLLSDKKIYWEYRKNALKYSENFDWRNIFNNMIS